MLSGTEVRRWKKKEKKNNNNKQDLNILEGFLSAVRKKVRKKRDLVGVIRDVCNFFLGMRRRGGVHHVLFSGLTGGKRMGHSTTCCATCGTIFSFLCGTNEV